jgi:uncharacterized protein (DUF2384 family)
MQPDLPKPPDGRLSRSDHNVSGLVAQVQRIMAESADPDVARTFDAAGWVAVFLAMPHPALGGQRPTDLIGTADGYAVVSRLIAQQSSAYA